MVVEIGAVVQDCQKLASNRVVKDVEFDEVFEVAECGGEVMGGDAFVGEEKLRDSATTAINL